MSGRRLLKFRLAAGLLAASLALGTLVSPAHALTADDVGKVTQILGELEPNLGRLAYDEEAADQWFDDDAELDGRIAAAGFSRESWKEALDATFRGYLATIPETEIETRFAELKAKLEASSSLTSAQKDEMRTFVATKIAETRGLRAEGRQYLGIVRPYADKLNELLGDEEE
ncbi:hypothetical protein [Mesorhizobium sp. ANAO-SY3R2]|uniref:hypothetical protein n=1 Tax=Mesorhizobium sp. ANAO-SY3R2 TaxID=3166644 RepID=UPI00366BC269